MTNHCALAVKQLVWGKVEPHPWWPGKIAQIIVQNNTSVYKVNFFGDSTYCFLKQQDLISYPMFNFDQNSSFAQNFKLQRAIKQAQKVYNHLLLAAKVPQDDAISPVQLTSNSTEKLFLEEHGRSYSESNKHEQQNQETNHQVETTDSFRTKITSENVVSLIESFSFSQKDSYSYTNRKQAISYQQQLKDVLLAKYNLTINSNIEKSKCDKQNSADSLQIKNKEKKIKKNGRQGKQNMNFLKNNYEKLVIRKISKILSGIRDLQTSSKSKAIEIHKQIERKAAGFNNQYIKLATKVILNLKQSKSVLLNMTDFTNLSFNI